MPLIKDGKRYDFSAIEFTIAADGEMSRDEEVTVVIELVLKFDVLQTR
jgi:hypothetical protein